MAVCLRFILCSFFTIFLLEFPLQTIGHSADLQAPWLTMSHNTAAWAALPKALEGAEQSLPSWARVLAPRLPASTAALLELDFAHRTKSPVAADLRAAMRFVMAEVNRCDYAKKAALLDLEGANATESMRDSLIDGTFTGWSSEQKRALVFAKKMSASSNSVTDQEFSELVSFFGERQAAAMVLLAAYANMQDRLLICVGADVDSDIANNALAPLRIRFDPAVYQLQRKHPPTVESLGLATKQNTNLFRLDKSWKNLEYSDLQERLSQQRDKQTRLSIPDWDLVAKNLPEGMFDRRSDIVWYRIVFGYAPELAIPFESFMRTAGAETSTNYPRIFGTSLFWVVTRCVECPYCMGHCEMNWEVAGLTTEQIIERSKKLAGDDWSEFPEHQQRAFGFAVKLSQMPAEVTATDLKDLSQDHGMDTAVAIVLNVSRYHYMTRISNGFQLQLESENVFFDYWNRQRQPDSHSNTQRQAFVPLLSDSATWKQLPKTVRGNQDTLPLWARAIAAQMPRTAAAMLELDYAHRTLSPLDPKLRAKMRWVIANTNKCVYSQTEAIMDLRRAHGTDAECASLISSTESWPAEDREALEFARLMTLAAPTVSDEMFERLKNRYGERQVASMVLLTAYGNFLDRIILGLGLHDEGRKSFEPVPVKFAEGALQVGPILPLDRGTETYDLVGNAIVSPDPQWMSVKFNALQLRLEQQRNRTPRLPIPSWEEVKDKLPPEMAAKPTRINWSLMNYGYAPELAIPWSIATRTHWSEAPAERILEESAFWVQTRALECNYCMGHCEMLLEETGLNRDAIASRTKLLAETDWSMFPVAEQRVYAYARKLSRAPWEMTATDYQSLQDSFGPQRAMGIFWWLCRGLYMTRISDGFQLPLERENVFANHGSPTPVPSSR